MTNPANNSSKPIVRSPSAPPLGRNDPLNPPYPQSARITKIVKEWKERQTKNQ